MSKAFVKESENESEDSEEELAEASRGIPQGTKNYITPGGYEKLRLELKDLLDKQRPELVKTVSWAASNGDRSENADYIYGKRRLREIDRRIRFLQKRLENAEIVNPSKQKSDRVLFGATVTIENEEGVKHTYQIVGIDESNPAAEKISWIAPLAKALLNSKKGDVVSFRSPKGEEDLTILEIKYQ